MISMGKKLSISSRIYAMRYFKLETVLNFIGTKIVSCVESKYTRVKKQKNVSKKSLNLVFKAKICAIKSKRTNSFCCISASSTFAVGFLLHSYTGLI